jgi:pimeloyl-ACP methyl ester carboxylesterase
MAEFILGMRKQFLQEKRKIIIVTHDWGAIVGARLAAEASVLADQWIIASAFIVGSPKSPQTAHANVETTASSDRF